MRASRARGLARAGPAGGAPAVATRWPPPRRRGSRADPRPATSPSVPPRRRPPASCTAGRRPPAPRTRPPRHPATTPPSSTPPTPRATPRRREPPRIAPAPRPSAPRATRPSRWQPDRRSSRALPRSRQRIVPPVRQGTRPVTHQARAVSRNGLSPRPAGGEPRPAAARAARPAARRRTLPPARRPPRAAATGPRSRRSRLRRRAARWRPPRAPPPPELRQFVWMAVAHGPAFVEALGLRVERGRGVPEAAQERHPVCVVPDRGSHGPARPGHPPHLAHAGRGVGHEVHDQLRESGIEGVVLERQRLRRGDLHPDSRHPRGARLGERLGGIDGGNALCPEPLRQRRRQRPGTAPHVERPLARLQPRSGDQRRRQLGP